MYHGMTGFKIESRLIPCVFAWIC